MTKNCGLDTRQRHKDMAVAQYQAQLRAGKLMAIWWGLAWFCIGSVLTAGVMLFAARLVSP